MKKRLNILMSKTISEEIVKDADKIGMSQGNFLTHIYCLYKKLWDNRDKVVVKKNNVKLE